MFDDRRDAVIVSTKTIKDWRAMWMEQNPCEDGHDHVTPFDEYLFGQIHLPDTITIYCEKSIADPSHIIRMTFKRSGTAINLAGTRWQRLLIHFLTRSVIKLITGEKHAHEKESQQSS